MLSDIIVNEEDDLKPLYFCHTTKWENFEKVLKSGVLQVDFSKFPPNSEKADDNVIYLFYGLPLFSYKVSPNTISANFAYDLPIGILFKSDIVKILSRFYPFDTGAAFNNMYKCFRRKIETPEDIADFCVEIMDEGKPLRQFIKRYFITNKNYCWCLPKCPDASCELEEEIIQLHKTYGNNSELDQRSTAIEVHSKYNIEINSNNVEAFIIPLHKSEQYKWVNKIKEQYPDIDVIKYIDVCRNSPDIYRQQLITKTIERYLGRNII